MLTFHKSESKLRKQSQKMSFIFELRGTTGHENVLGGYKQSGTANGLCEESIPQL